MTAESDGRRGIQWNSLVYENKSTTAAQEKKDRMTSETQERKRESEKGERTPAPCLRKGKARDLEGVGEVENGAVRGVESPDWMKTEEGGRAISGKKEVDASREREKTETKVRTEKLASLRRCRG